MYDEVFTTTTQYREVQTWGDSRQAVKIWDVAQQGAGPRDGQRLAEKTPGYKLLTHSQLNNTDLELHKAGFQGNTLFLFLINFPKSRRKLGCDVEQRTREERDIKAHQQTCKDDPRWVLVRPPAKVPQWGGSTMRSHCHPM